MVTVSAAGGLAVEVDADGTWRVAWDEPDWLGLTLEPAFNGLGSGQLAVLDLAAALKNVKTRCDSETQIRCMLAMQLVASGAIP